jgi:enoyl-[acyl-carrier-protein] reductase (NADH)
MTNLLLQSKPEILARWEDDNPLQRIAWPNELKGPAIYLLSQASSFVTGSDIRVDGGVSVGSAVATSSSLTPPFSLQHCAW